jgi:SAM-dependent methyltransferase
MFDEQSFEEMYRATDALWSGRPNVQLVREVADLPPGTALDVGCGEGADAIWLAQRGWRVTAVDFAATALERGAAAAAAAGVADRIDWLRADVTRWSPNADAFDLVSAQYMHLPPDDRRALFARLAAAVRAGGTLLVAGHDVSEHPAEAHRPPAAERFFTAVEVAEGLEPATWEVVVAESRPGAQHAGQDIAVRDVVLRARKRRTGEKDH